MWLGAGPAAACLNPSRVTIGLRIVASSSPAFAASIRRSMRGRAPGANIRATSSSEKSGRAAERDQGRLLQHAGIELPAQSAARRRRTQTMLDAMFQPFEDRLVDMIPGAVSHRVNSGVQRCAGDRQVRHPDDKSGRERRAARMLTVEGLRLGS